MLTSAATLIAMAILLVLTIIWGRRQQALAGRYRLEAEKTRGLLIRSADYGRQWREEAIRLRELVDRVEG
jgi:hypothetical protein